MGCTRCRVSLLERTMRDLRERPSDEHVRRVVDGFSMPAFDEDNHHPGVARHLWCPWDEAARLAGECKVTETAIVDRDGYAWTTDTDGPCRGCLYEVQFGAEYPCPIHHPADDVGQSVVDAFNAAVRAPFPT